MFLKLVDVIAAEIMMGTKVVLWSSDVTFLAASLLLVCFVERNKRLWILLCSCITWRALDFYSNGEANQTSFRLLKISVAVLQDCLCHSYAHIVMKQPVFSRLAEHWIAFVIAVKLLNTSDASFHTCFNLVHLACFYDSLAHANKCTYWSRSKLASTKTRMLFTCSNII